MVIVLTRQYQVVNTGRKCDFCPDGFAVHYFVYREAGAQLTLTYTKRGQAAVDHKGDLQSGNVVAS